MRPTALSHAVSRPLIAAVMAVSALAVLPGCAVSRGQSSVGQYVDDATISTQIKSRFVADKKVDAVAIKVETLNGEVMLTGFAKNGEERLEAERIARGVNGVKTVRNDIVVRS
ncbi:MAG: hypothetical protein RIQ53_3156 [Pseudomonadota bacterium]|jgi:osmotically-inducible protein OsmY